MKKIQCCQIYGSNFDNFEDSISIIVVDPFEKNDALSEEQNCHNEKVSQAWEHRGVKCQHENNYDAV